MFNQSNHRHLGKTHGAVAVLSVLAAFGGSAAHAQFIPFNPAGNASQVGAGAVTTPAYPGSNGDTLGTFSQTVPGNLVTFSDNSVFTRINAPFDVNYPLGTALIETSDANNNTTGPLHIAFNQGVSAFGVSVQDYAYDTETFTLQAFNGANSLGSFTFAPVNNNPTATPQNAGQSVFVGAQATGGNLITSVIISSLSVDTASGTTTMYGNNFFAGPVTLAAPVPEASTLVGTGMSLFLDCGPSAEIIAQKSRYCKLSHIAYTQPMRDWSLSSAKSSRYKSSRYKTGLRSIPCQR